ncbi:Uma2 family endonuclease [Bythopirellula polymerisocia]|uniref:Putative restriction endonuclease domain-containing protein n=1 Tax=Bythopirellula polymerisocia TaxID=2528003 RepID=A0A5C6CFB6_9BACT|nr:Uma2 family endonuclease [Bythopirellula polymerisocia]TWU23583.1 hypothetical protein Pla144_37580 [Bythopirellula polymerisocia]
MASLLSSSSFAPINVAELVAHVGGVTGTRIRLKPAPGTATDQDLLLICEHEGPLCELLDGVLVEKAVGGFESYLTIYLAEILSRFARENKLGIVLGPDGMLRFSAKKIYLPDISFISWSQNPMSELQKQPIADLHPDLAVEVLSRSNTVSEMSNKRKDYFAWGVQVVWELDPPTKSMRVYTSPDKFDTIVIDGTLDGGAVLPGFKLQLAELFSEADRGS